MTAPIMFAHKGGRAHGPDNTLIAFAEALRRGVGGLESDVWLTADGVPVLDHDGLVGQRRIADLARTALPDHIPSVSELFAFCGTNFDLSLDLLDQAAAPAVLAVVADPSRLWLCYEEPTWTASLRALDPRVRLVHSAETVGAPAEFAGLLASLRAAGADAYNLHQDDWTAERIAQVHAAGLLAFGWDAHDAAAVAALLDLGCDGVYGDDVDVLLAAGR